MPLPQAGDIFHMAVYSIPVIQCQLDNVCHYATCSLALNGVMPDIRVTVSVSLGRLSAYIGLSFPTTYHLA